MKWYQDGSTYERLDNVRLVRSLRIRTTPTLMKNWYQDVTMSER